MRTFPFTALHICEGKMRMTSSRPMDLRQNGQWKLKKYTQQNKFVVSITNCHKTFVFYIHLEILTLSASYLYWTNDPSSPNETNGHILWKPCLRFGYRLWDCYCYLWLTKVKTNPDHSCPRSHLCKLYKLFRTSLQYRGSLCTRLVHAPGRNVRRAVDT